MSVMNSEGEDAEDGSATAREDLKSSMKKARKADAEYESDVS